MNAAHRGLAALFIAAALTACGAGRQEARESPPVEDTVSSAIAATMDEARAVEDAALQRKEEVDRALDAVEGDR